MSTKIFKGAGKPRFPQRKNVEHHDEYGKDKKGIDVCKLCWNVYFKKEWHRPDVKLYERKEIKGKEVHFVVCPADKMAEKGLWEGEILIQNVPEKYGAELLNFIIN